MSISAKANNRFLKVLPFLLIYVLSVSRLHAISYTWNGSINSDWGTPANWTPAGIPGIGDDVTINIATPSIILDNSRTIQSLVINAANTLNLNTFQLIVSDVINVTNGVIDNGSIFSLSLNSFNWQNTVTSATIEVTSNTWGACSNNTFNGAVRVTHSGGGNQTFGNNNTVNARFTFITLNGRFRLDPNGGSVYSGDSLILINLSSSNENIFLSQGGTVTVNCPIRVGSTSNGDLRLGANGTVTGGRINLGPGVVISTSGFINGDLFLQNVRAIDAVNQNFTVPNTASVTFLDTCTFLGDLTVVAGSYFTSLSRVSGIASFTKIGNGNNNVGGSNRFFSDVTIVNSGGGDSNWGTSAADTIDGNLTVTNNGTGGADIRIANNSIGNIIAGNVIATNNSNNGLTFSENAVSTLSIAGNIELNSLSGTIISFGNGGGSCTANGLFFIGAGGFLSGGLTIRNTTFNDPNPINLNLDPGAGTFFTDGSSYSGELSVTASGILVSNSLFQANTSFHKTGGGNNFSQGGNLFSGNLGLTLSGNGILEFGNVNPDSISGNLSLINSGSSSIFIAESSPNNFVAGTVSISNSANGSCIISNGVASNILIQGIVSLENTGTGTIGFGLGSTVLTTSSGLQLIGAGLTNGTLLLRNISNTSTNPVFLLGSGGTINFDNFSTSGTFNSTAGAYAMSNSRFSGNTEIIKTGAGNNNLVGGNRFFANLSTGITAGAGYILYGNSAADTVNGNLTLTNTGTERTIFAHNSPNNVIGGNVTIQNAGSSTIWLGNNPLATVSVGGNIILENNSAAGVQIGSGGGAVTIAAGSNIQTTGVGFVGGTLNIANLIQNGSTNSTLFLSGAIATFNNNDFGGSLDLQADRLTVNNCIFRQNASLIKTGATQDVIAGNNKFLANLSTGITSNGNLIYGNTTPDSVFGNLTLSNIGSALLVFANNSSGNFVSGTYTVLNTGSGTIWNSRNGAASLTIGGNILLSNTTGTSIIFGESGGSTVLNSGNSISITGSGFTGGLIQLRNFTQLGFAASNISGTGTASIDINSCNFGGTLSLTAADLNFRQSTFNTAFFSKTGGANQTSFGGNTFNGGFFYGNTGNSNFIFANNLPDVYNASVSIDNFGTGQVRLSEATAGNSIVSNLTLNNQSTGSITVCNGGVATLNINGNIQANNINGGTINLNTGNGASLISLGNLEINSPNGGTINLGNASNNTEFNGLISTISIGGSGFSNTNSAWNRVIKLNSSSATLLTTSGNSSLTINNSRLAGNFTSSSSSVILQRNRFIGNLSVSKTGTVDNISTGSNFINGDASFSITGPNYLMMGNGNADTVQGNMSINLSNTGSFYFGRAGANHRVGGSIFINSTGTATVFFSEQPSANLFIGGNVSIECSGCNGVRFGTGSTNQAPGGGILTGAGGINSGTYLFRNYTQSGSAANLLNTTGSTLIEFFGSAFGGNFTANASRLLMRQNTFSGTTNFSRNSTTNDDNFGGNTFSGAAIMTNNGPTARWLFGNNQPDLFNSSVNLVNTNSGSIRLSFNSVGTIVNGPILLSNTGTGTITVSENTGTTTINSNVTLENALGGTIGFGNNGLPTTISSGGNLLIGGLGFSGGNLSMRAVTVTGVGNATLNTSGNTNCTFNNCSFGGNLTATSGQITIRETTVNGNTNLTKTQPGNNTSLGGNTFGGTFTLTHNSTDLIRWGDNAGLPDIFSGDITLQNNSTGTIELARNNQTDIRGNLTMNSPNPILFSANNGSIVFNGGGNQTISGTAPTATIRRVTVNKPGGTINLNTPVNFALSLTLTSGVINTTSTNILRLQNATTLTGGSTLSHVNGPMIKVGNQTFDFPVGKGGVYAPISISSAGATTDQFRAEYFNTSPNTLYPNVNRESSIDRTSGCEYWILDRLVGTAARFVTIGWDDPRSCGVNDFNQLLVCRWNGSQWINEGAANFTGNNTAGTLRSVLAINSFSPFTLGSSIGINPLPITGIELSAESFNREVLLSWKVLGTFNNAEFEIQRSGENGVFATIHKLWVNTPEVENEYYEFIDKKAPSGKLYYRIVSQEENSRIVSNHTFVYRKPYTTSIYPNQIERGDNVTVYSEIDDASAVITISSINGAETIEIYRGLQSGAQTLTLDNRPSGIYLLSVISLDQGTVLREKIVVR